jgi:hypothetical protein
MLQGKVLAILLILLRPFVTKHRADNQDMKARLTKALDNLNKERTETVHAVEHFVHLVEMVYLKRSSEAGLEDPWLTEKSVRERFATVAARERVLLQQIKLIIQEAADHETKIVQQLQKVVSVWVKDEKRHSGIWQVTSA